MDKLELIVKTLNNNFATDIVGLDMRLASPLFDTFVIASVANSRLLSAVVDHVEEACAKEDYFLKRKEGAKDSNWILMDFGDIIVHIFLKEERSNYNLEKLWADQGRLDLTAYLEDAKL